MVGQQVLVLSIGVRIPVPEQKQSLKALFSVLLDDNSPIDKYY